MNKRTGIVGKLTEVQKKWMIDYDMPSPLDSAGIKKMGIDFVDKFGHTDYVSLFSSNSRSLFQVTAIVRSQAKRAALSVFGPEQDEYILSKLSKKTRVTLKELKSVKRGLNRKYNARFTLDSVRSQWEKLRAGTAKKTAKKTSKEKEPKEETSIVAAPRMEQKEARKEKFALLVGCEIIWEGGNQPKLEEIQVFCGVSSKGIPGCVIAVQGHVLDRIFDEEPEYRLISFHDASVKP